MSVNGMIYMSTRTTFTLTFQERVVDSFTITTHVECRFKPF